MLRHEARVSSWLRLRACENDRAQHLQASLDGLVQHHSVCAQDHVCARALQRVSRVVYGKFVRYPNSADVEQEVARGVVGVARTRVHANLLGS